MKKKPLRRRYSSEQKAQIVLEILKEQQTLAQLSAGYGVHVNQLRLWKTQVLERLPAVFSDEHQALRNVSRGFGHSRKEFRFVCQAPPRPGRAVPASSGR